MLKDDKPVIMELYVITFGALAVAGRRWAIQLGV